MGHKTLINGTSYGVTGGKSLVSGTSYTISKGRALVQGTGYDILFTPIQYNHGAVAMEYSDGSLVFQMNDKVESGKTLTAKYSLDWTDDYISSDIPWASNKSSIQNVYFKTEFKDNKNINGIFCWFNDCTNLTAFNSDNLNIHKIQSMHNAFSNCYNLTTSPISGNSVTTMACAYEYCNKITGFPVCGPNVTNLYRTYLNCRNLTGSPVCGNSVTNMAYAYDECTRLTGSPVCGSKVTNMSYAYYNCTSLTGPPVCGNSVTTMAYAYYRCTNLTGPPACGSKVTNMLDAYLNCKNLSGNAYFYSSSVSKMTYCFGGRNNCNKRLNIYVTAGSKTNTQLHYNNTYSISLINKAKITWTDNGTCQYNTQYNVYIYPVSNVAQARIDNGD